MSLISIIIPSFNRALLIGKTIESVIMQTYKEWELIVVDDGSTDNTESVINEYILAGGNIRFFKRDELREKGANTCRNIGLEVSRGTFVKWLDSDDLLHPECLAEQYLLLTKENADACICQTGLFEQAGETVTYLDRRWSAELSGKNITDALILGKIRWSVMSGLWDKKVLNKKPFTEGLMNSQEWLFHIVMSVAGVNIVFTNKILTYARVHSGSMSHKSAKRSEYYYHSALARVYALALFTPHNKPSSKVRLYLLRKFFRYQFFCLYKGGIVRTLKLCQYYPQTLSSFI